MRSIGVRPAISHYRDVHSEIVDNEEDKWLTLIIGDRSGESERVSDDSFAREREGGRCGNISDFLWSLE